MVLFQSMRQFTSWALMVSLSCVALQQLFRLLGGNQVPPAVLILAMAGGAAQSLIWVLKGSMTVVTPGISGQAQLESELMRLGYGTGERENEKTVYRQNLPRWLLWDESNMDVVPCAEGFLLKGPYFTLRKLKSKLLDG